MVYETWLKSDLKKPMRVVPLTGNLFSADNNGNLIGVEVLDNGQPAQLTGAVTGYVIRADGATVTVVGTLSGNKASIVLPASAYIVVGQISIVIKVGTVTVGACVSNVYRTSTDTLVDPGHVIPDISELLAEIENMRTATAAANTATTNANAATSNANTAANTANTAASNANAKATLADTAATTANTAAGKIDNMTVAATTSPEGSQASVTITEVNGHKHVAFGIPKGDKGKDFHIAFTFASIAAMEAYSGDIELYDYAMIDTGNVQDADTGKLYCYEQDDEWHYIGDLSGAQGIKGETGTGIDHVTLNADYTLTIYYDDGTSETTTSIRGATGITPAISIGSVTTLTPNQQAFVELDQTSTPEAPVFNFGIPKGDTGSAENVYGSTLPMSPQDSTKVETAINAKLDANQGSENAGKFMRVSSTGAVVYDYPTERYASLNDFPATGDEEKLYIAEDNGKIYVWNDEYVPVGGSSEEDCEASGDIVSFDTFESPVKELMVNIDPVQDLHGYDHPWPAGGGKNKFDYQIVSPMRSENGITYTVNDDGSVTLNGTATNRSQIYWNMEADDVHQFSGMLLDCFPEAIPGVSAILEESGGKYTSYAVQRSGTSTPVTINSSIEGNETYANLIIRVTEGTTINNKKVYPMIRPADSQSGYSPYSNICPITGWTVAKVTRTGKNLFEPTEDTYKVQSGITFNGYDVESLVAFLNTLKIGSYIISFKFNILETISGATSWGILIQNTQSGYNDGRINGQHDSGETLTFTKTFTITESNIGKYAHAYLYSGGGNKAKVYWYDFQIELGSTATAYEPYQGETYDITFPSEAGTVYGGTLDVTTGLLKVDKAEVDLGTLTWSVYQASNGSFTTPLGEMVNNSTDALSSQYLAVRNYSEWTSRDRAFYKDTNGKLHLKDSTYANYSVSDFKTAMSGVQLVYPLATPVTYQLTNQQVIQLLEGRNVLWSDTGDILSLKYYRTKVAYQVDKNTEDIAGKANKVSNATSGNLAGLDTNGNLTDSGIAAGDVAAKEDVNSTQDGIAIIVDGDTATVAVPVGGYAYIKNNTHGLTEGMYKNTSSSAFPVSGGTADSTVFTIVSTGAVNDAFESLNNILKGAVRIYCIFRNDDPGNGLGANTLTDDFSKCLGFFIRMTTQDTNPLQVCGFIRVGEPARRLGTSNYRTFTATTTSLSWTTSSASSYNTQYSIITEVWAVEYVTDFKPPIPPNRGFTPKNW